MVLQHYLNSWFLQHGSRREYPHPLLLLSPTLSCRGHVGTLVTWAREVMLDHQDQR